MFSSFTPAGTEFSAIISALALWYKACYYMRLAFNVFFVSHFYIVECNCLDIFNILFNIPRVVKKSIVICKLDRFAENIWLSLHKNLFSLEAFTLSISFSVMPSFSKRSNASYTAILNLLKIFSFICPDGDCKLSCKLFRDDCMLLSLM